MCVWVIYTVYKKYFLSTRANKGMLYCSDLRWDMDLSVSLEMNKCEALAKWTGKWSQVRKAKRARKFPRKYTRAAKKTF